MAEPSQEAVIAELERERDLWATRYHRIMDWVTWLRDDVCHWSERPTARMNWAGLNRSVGTEDLFMASVEIEAEAAGHAGDAAVLAASKDRQFRALALQSAESNQSSGRAKGSEM